VTIGNLLTAAGEITLQDLQGEGRKTVAGSGQMWLFWCAIGALVLLLLGWAVFIRKRRRQAQGLWQGHHQRNKRVSGEGSNGGIGSGERRRRRRKRRARRSSNPTLAESGGLPPIRGESQR